jgi:hypothetical protein
LTFDVIVYIIYTYTQGVNNMGALTVGQKLALYKCHFIPSEVIAFDHAKTPTGKDQHFDFESPTWKTMLKNRITRVRNLRAKGMKDEQIDSMISGWYRQSKDRTPWDLLISAGSPSARMKTESDADMARRLLANTKVRSLLGGYPVTPARGVVTPRNIPRPPSN